LSQPASRVLSEFRAAFVKDIKIYSRYPSWVLGDVLVAPLWFVFFLLSVFIFSPASASSGALGGTLNYFFWGYAFVMLFNSGLVGIGQYMVTEQTSGTLEQILMAPVNRLTLVAGRWVMAMVTDAIIVLCTAIFLVATENVRIEVADPLSLALVIGLLEIGLLGLGLLFAGITLRFKGIVSALNYVWFGVVILSGVFFPISAFPRALEGIAVLLPTTFYVDMIKHSAIQTPSILAANTELVLLCAFSSVMMVGGWYVFGVMERLVKEQGKTGQY
jgi:ABC-2 type transport system permease protein